MDLQQSVGKILKNDSLVANRFYERFFESHPEVRPLFEKVHMTTQAVMLTMALQAIREHPNISNASKLYLRVLGSRRLRAEIGTQLFPAFVDSLLATLEEFHGDEWNEGLKQQWRAGLDNAASLMQEGYESRFHV